MSIPLRSRIIFAGSLFIAAFGAGQVWSLVDALRHGTTGPGTALTGVLGAVVLAVSVTVLLRMLYLLQHAPASVAIVVNQEKDGVEDEQ